MAEVLSQNQIDALLSAALSGNMDLELPKRISKKEVSEVRFL